MRMPSNPTSPGPTGAGSTTALELVQAAEAALKRFGFSKIPPVGREPRVHPEFWVQEAGVPRRTFPVFVERGPAKSRLDEWIRFETRSPGSLRRAIFVVPNDRAAEETWAELRHKGSEVLDPEVAILVLPPRPGSEGPPHWHARIVDRAELLSIATGIVVGLFRRAQETEGSAQIDFEEMLETLKNRFGIDVRASLGVESDPDALFLLYQLALKDAYAPGDAAANLHLLVLKPTGPAARLPWFAG